MLHLTSKNVIVIGSFDVLDDTYLKLIKKARKMAYQGSVIAIIYDDFTSYKINRKFPIQTTEQRKHNINYFVDNIFTITDIETINKTILNILKGLEEIPTAVVHYLEDGKSFPGREVFKANGNMIKFVYKDKI